MGYTYHGILHLLVGIAVFKIDIKGRMQSKKFCGLSYRERDQSPVYQISEGGYVNAAVYLRVRH